MQIRTIEYKPTAKAPKPCSDAIHVYDVYWACFSTCTLEASATVLTAEQLKKLIRPLAKRMDLDLTHPLRDQYALPSVPAGMPDIEIDADGYLTLGGEKVGGEIVGGEIVGVSR